MNQQGHTRGKIVLQAIAAQRAGATWAELHKVMQLAATVAALGAMNRGSGLLNDLRKQSTEIKH